MPVFVYPTHLTTPQHVQTASLADIHSSPVPPPRFPTPPQSHSGFQSPTPHNRRSMSPHDLSSSPQLNASPRSDFSPRNSLYGSPQRSMTMSTFDTPPFSPTITSVPSHLLRKRGHQRGYSTTSILSTTSFVSSDSSPSPPYLPGPAQVKSRGQRATNVPEATMSSYISGPDPGDHKFKCLFPQCGKKFGRKYNIQSHIQTHLSDRPYRCGLCSAAFVRHHDLRRHEKIHAGDKPFVCACSKGFARQDALTRHRQRYLFFNFSTLTFLSHGDSCFSCILIGLAND